MYIFVERLEQRMADLKLTQEQVAERSGVGLRRVQRALVSTEEKPPKLDLVLKLAKGLDTSVGYLSGETEDPAPPPDEERLGLIETITLLLERGEWLAAIREISEGGQSAFPGNQPLQQK